MPFIGNQPALSYTSFAKQDFTTSATTSYTLDNPVANANELALFINFVRQEPTTAYSASGVNLTLTSATSSSDDMYCVYLGKAVQTVNPPNASVGASQIVDSSIALGKLSASGTKDSTTFLRGDNTFASAGISSAQQWRIASSFSINSGSELTVTGWEKQDQSFAGSIGSDFSESSGVFTFPTTGIYLIIAQFNFGSNDYVDTNTIFKISVSSNSGGAYTNQSQAWLGYETDGNPPSRETATCHALVNVTDASTFRTKFLVHNLDGTNAFLEGSTDYNSTNIVFIKIG
jgi:hypothetical protein